MAGKKANRSRSEESAVDHAIRARIRLNEFVGKIRRELEGLEAQIREMEERLSQLTPTGSLQEKFVKCGRPGCRCTRGKGHGPYYYLTVKEKGKAKTIYLGREPKLPEGYISPREYARLQAQLKELRRRRDELVERLDRAVEILSNSTP